MAENTHFVGSPKPQVLIFKRKNSGCKTNQKIQSLAHPLNIIFTSFPDYLKVHN